MRVPLGLLLLAAEMHSASPAAAGTIGAAPSLGLLLTLVAGGAAADRYGEPTVMVLGLSGGGLLLAATETFAARPVRARSVY